MLTLVRSIVSRFGCRFRSRAVVELENLALRHQLHVLRRQRPGRPRLFAIDRLLWVWMYRIPNMAALPGRDGVGQARHRRSMAPSRLSYSGVGVREQGDRQWISKFARWFGT